VCAEHSARFEAKDAMLLPPLKRHRLENMPGDYLENLLETLIRVSVSPFAFAKIRLLAHIEKLLTTSLKG